MTLLESIAFVLGVANVTLVVRRSLWNYPIALVMVSLYGLLFWRERLYSDAALQLFFFVINLYGWIVWRRSLAEQGAVRVETLTLRAQMAWVAGIATAALLWGGAMAHSHRPAGCVRRDGAGESCGIKLRILAENSVFIEGLSPVAVQIGRDAGQTRNAVMQSDQRGIIALDRCHPLREHVA